MARGHDAPNLPALSLGSALTVGYHAYTWWKVAPKTAPDLRFGGKPLPEPVITGGGWPRRSALRC